MRGSAVRRSPSMSSMRMIVKRWQTSPREAFFTRGMPATSPTTVMRAPASAAVASRARPARRRSPGRVASAQPRRRAAQMMSQPRARG